MASEVSEVRQGIHCAESASAMAEVKGLEPCLLDYRQATEYLNIGKSTSDAAIRTGSPGCMRDLHSLQSLCLIYTGDLQQWEYLDISPIADPGIPTW